jgi:pimeloyl-ACP methyl ester carboxylesterase
VLREPSEQGRRCVPALSYVRPMSETPSNVRRVIQAPDRLLQLAESRAVFELGALVAASPLLRLVGRGDRHPVLVLPGFTASDRSTQPLRVVLRSQGYWTHRWGLGPNIGPTERIIDGMQDRLLQLFERHGCRVSVVGWSLGGIYARELARANPDHVRQVITLGSPFRMLEGDRSSATPLVDQMSSRFNVDWTSLYVDERDRSPLPVPSTAVYTRSDGVVRWHMCIDEQSERHENIEVLGSHSGLGFNPAVIFAVSDRLAQREDDWRPFSAPIGLRHLYPRPAYFHHAA